MGKHWKAALAAIGCVLAMAGWARGQAVSAFQRADVAPGGHTVLSVDHLALKAAAGERLRLDNFPLPGGGSVDLSLEPFSFIPPDASFVVADEAGERAADFDPASIHFWRGTVDGLPGSHVFISATDTSNRSVMGRIELGAGRSTFVVSSEGGDPAAGGVALGEGQVVVFEGRGGFDPSFAPHLCGVGIQPIGPREPLGTDEPEATITPAYGKVIPGLRMVRIAVDADYAMSTLFETEREGLTYLVQMYAIVCDIFVRDTGVRLDLAFMRLWTTPDHPYSGGVGRPVIPSGIDHDAAQLMSGRKDAPSGGQAYGLCNRASWVGYGIGRFTDPSVPNVFNQDIAVAAHEFGHSLGTGHTHDYGIDACASTTTPPRRGTIMSYCATTFTGGSAIRDMHFHTGVRQRIRNCVGRYAPFDCNQNHIDDAEDIASGRSIDANDNGVPDECEDCNANGVLDTIDIATGLSQDLNGNRVPDECEPDCNGNGVPDDKDIVDRTSLDANGDAIPDECQPDMDGNGVFDWVDIFNDMGLDLNRDAVLDAVQDCDGDGVHDIITLAHAHNTWTADPGTDTVAQHHFLTGVPRSASAPGVLSDPLDVLVTPDRRVLVASAGDARIVEFALDGS
ncbi:MAG: M12 family metallo-peptidase, partial [Phycisphaerales bacterium JB064]